MNLWYPTLTSLFGQHRKTTQIIFHLNHANGVDLVSRDWRELNNLWQNSAEQIYLFEVTSSNMTPMWNKSWLLYITWSCDNKFHYLNNRERNLQQLSLEKKQARQYSAKKEFLAYWILLTRFKINSHKVTSEWSVNFGYSI